jgi:hypothetical protein
LPTSILTAAALFAYLMPAILLAEIYVPFVCWTGARKVSRLQHRVVAYQQVLCG